MAFNIGLSGIRAASTDLEVTGNNIANASTIGFKESRTEFGDVYTTTLLGTGAKPPGSGVMVENIRQEFSQGNVSSTGNALDLAVDGNGFFVMNDRGSVSYTRAGVFSLDKDGFVVSNSGARLQGYEANDTGVVSGVLGDISIQISNQPPKLTRIAAALLNLNAGALVLQEQGLQVNTNGLAVGAADSGIIESTNTVLKSAGQPTTGGTAASTSFVDDLTAQAPFTYGAASIDIDLGDGLGPQTVTLTGVTGGTVQDVLNDVQAGLDATFGSQQLRASQDPTTGALTIERSGYNATNGSTFSLSNEGAWAAIFSSTSPATIPTVSIGTAGSTLFVGSNPLTADLRSIPGTQTTTRTTSTPPLNIVDDFAGVYASLQANSPISSINLTTTNSLNFNIAVDGGDTYPINLSQASWISSAPITNPTPTQIVTEINAQIAALSGGVPQVQASQSAGQISFAVTTNANPGDFIQIADVPSINNDLTDLGFIASNRLNAGQQAVVANNRFDIQVRSADGDSGVKTIIIPESNYASLNDLAAAIQDEMNVFIGSTGLFGKVSVEAVSGQLVFTNTQTGSAEGIDITATAGYGQSLTDLGFDSLFKVSGDDEIDRTNSFSINLTVPAPDSEGRSGSVLISLDEEFRSVQQIAAAINRQLNSQDANGYIGVRASALEIEPRTVPPQYTLQLSATEGGESSIISISNLTAGGPDISEADLYALLQVNPDDATLLTQGIEGVTNEYPAQEVTLVDPEGNETDITIPKHAEANEIVSIFNQQPGVTANAETVMTIPLSGYNNPADNMSLTLNGQVLESTTLEEIAYEINAYRATTLPGFRAEVNEIGDLVITNDIGRDIKLSIDSSSVTDSIIVQGAENTGPVVLGGTSTADVAAAVGGSVNFVFNEGYTLKDPVPVVSGIFGALTDDEFTPFVLNAFDPADQKTYNSATSTTIYDSLGNAHVMTQFFVKEPLDPSRPTEQNVWAMYVQVDGRDVGDPDASLPFPENLAPTAARYELFFNSDGTLDEIATGDINITNWDPVDENGDPTGALTSTNVLEGGLPVTEASRNSNFQISLDGSTQFGSAFAVNEVSQDGYSTGRLTGLEVDQEGIIFARFTNGQAQTLGQVALANFRNPEGLTPLGSTSWAESFESGTPTVGSPRTASFGQIQSSSLEDSNVDLSEQLVRLIIAQRNFQASAKTIETTDQITQTILNI
ncbi:MAG: flagellar hook-basal body complex protein [Oleibacter sp.]|nr:flagellar hook-basal body complex protein [Thalassolituus sp.]